MGRARPRACAERAALVVRVRPVLDQVPATGDRVVEAREVADREDVRSPVRRCRRPHRAAVEGETRVGEVPCRRLDTDATIARSASMRRPPRVVAWAEATVAVQFRQSRRRARPRRRGPGRAARARSTARDGRVPRRAARQARSPSRQDRGPQRGRRLHPDEARADDERPAGRAGGVLDAERVVEGAIAEDAREALAGNPSRRGVDPVASTSRS